MRRPHLMAAVLLAASALTGCNDENNRASTASGIAAERIRAGTSDTAEPIDLNSRSISDRDIRETTRPRAL